MELTAALSGNGKNLIVSWDAVPGALGYVFSRDGKRVSNTWDATVTQVTFGIPDSQQHTYSVQALSQLDLGVTMWPAPPAPTGTTGTTGVTGVTAVSGATGPASPGMPNQPPPAYTPSRNVAVTSQSAFNTAISNAQPGDLIVVTGVTFTGEVVISKALSSIAEVHFVNCKATGAAAGTQLPSFWVHNASNWRFYGCDITGKSNNGIRFDGGTNFQWWDFNIHDCAGTGIYMEGGSGINNVSLRGTLTNNGLDLSLDPHAEKGTGNHGINIGGGDGIITNCYFELTVPSQPYGAAFEIQGLQNSTIYLDARNVNFHPVSQTAGNAIQVWGDNTKNVQIPYIYGENLTGKVSEMLYLGSGNTGINFTYGRSLNVAGSPKYQPATGVTYTNCT